MKIPYGDQHGAAPTLTVFANFRINDGERFLRMQDSFRSIRDIAATRWVVNARGVFGERALLFLKDSLGDKLIGSRLESRRGWFHDARTMLSHVDGDYVLFWIEDHINLAPPEVYNSIVKEMAESGSDYINYTWWFGGLGRAAYDHIRKNDYQHIETFELNVENVRAVRISGRRPFLISAPSIFGRDLFAKIVLATDPKLRRWPKETPFDFEKTFDDQHWLPIKMAISKMELFAAIDDDNGVLGYCLQARGQYPKRQTRQPKCINRSRARVALSALIPMRVKQLFVRMSYHLPW